MPLLELLDQLEALIAQGRRVVFTPNVIVNEEEALDLVDRARLELPEEIKQARWTVERQQALVAEAEQAGQEIVARATEEAAAIERAGVERAQAMISGSSVAEAAEERAAGLLAEAEQATARIRAGADAYVRESLGRLEAQLARLLGEVRKGIESLPAGDG